MPYPFFNYPYPQMQPQNGNIVHVQSEEQARSWNVALGSSVTFIDDTKPYCYTKSMGLSQFEPPVFKRFRLVEETAPQSIQNAQEQASNIESANLSDYLTKAEFEPFKSIIADMQVIVKELTGNESIKQPTEPKSASN